MKTLACAFVGAALVSMGGLTQKPAKTVDPVAVVGCLRETAPDTWMLVDASDPIRSTANAPTAQERAELPEGGSREFRLIGVGIFDLPAHRDHSVIVKGLAIDAKPMSRLNVTSLTMKAATCPPRPPGK